MLWVLIYFRFPNILSNQVSDNTYIYILQPPAPRIKKPVSQA